MMFPFRRDIVKVLSAKCDLSEEEVPSIIVMIIVMIIITSNTASSREVVTPSTLSLHRKLRADLSLLSPGVSPATVEHGLIFD